MNADRPRSRTIRCIHCAGRKAGRPFLPLYANWPFTARRSDRLATWRPRPRVAATAESARSSSPQCRGRAGGPRLTRTARSAPGPRQSARPTSGRSAAVDVDAVVDLSLRQIADLDRPPPPTAQPQLIPAHQHQTQGAQQRQHGLVAAPQPPRRGFRIGRTCRSARRCRGIDLRFRLRRRRSRRLLDLLDRCGRTFLVPRRACLCVRLGRFVRRFASTCHRSFSRARAPRLYAPRERRESVHNPISVGFVDRRGCPKAPSV
jgi:hypothetical protein